jgi:hypothetical protein
VTTNGGSVSTNTLAAASAFCAAIDAAGIRGRFARLSLLCGNSDASLNAVRTPLYRSTSFGGTGLGGTIDTNINFVQGDYAETGANGGLKGSTSTAKVLATGLDNATVAFAGNGNVHISAYVTAADSGNTFNYWAGNGTGFIGPTYSSGSGAFYKYSSMDLLSSASSFTGHFIGTSTSGSAHACYSAGASIATSSTVTNQPWSGELAVFNNSASSPLAALGTDSRLAAYSFGPSLNATQAAAYYAAIQAFQTALGRNK